jgi:uncharacterized protein
VGIHFEWDKNKAEATLKKHKVSFTEAATVFKDVLSITIHDPTHSQREGRFVTTGYSYSHRIIIVVHTDRGDKIRVISARLATRLERKTYEEKD